MTSPISGGEDWMVQAAVDAAPPLSAATIDTLRRVLGPQNRPQPCTTITARHAEQRQAA